MLIGNNSLIMTEREYSRNPIKIEGWPRALHSTISIDYCANHQLLPHI